MRWRLGQADAPWHGAGPTESMTELPGPFIDIRMSRFVVFEGLDGSGKSSLMRALEAELSRQQIPFHQTREPGGTPLGEEIRPLILRKGGPVPVPRAELLLYEASRAQHVEETIRPQLARGAWVVSDRFAASSVAFQAGGRAIEARDVAWLNRFATAGLEPDLNILLDLTVEEARARRGHRHGAGGEEEDRMESEAEAFHERVRTSFLEQAKAGPERWLVLPARETPAELLERLLTELRRRAWLA